MSDGSFAYQDRPCAPHHDAGMHIIKATPGGEVPPGVKAEQKYVSSRNAPPAAQGPTAAQFFRAPQPVAQQEPLKGYKCEVGWRVFYQETPCPELAPDGKVTTITHVERDQWGNFVRSESVDLPHMRPTSQTELTRREMCEGQRAQLDPYTRYTTPNPCKGL